MRNKVVICIALITSITIICSNEAKCQWEQTFWPLQLHCFGSLGSKIFAGANGDSIKDGIIVSTDNGNSWAIESGLINTQVNCLVSLGKYLIAGANGSIIRSSDSGTTWVNVLSNFPNATFSALATKGQKIFASAQGAIFRSGDSGATWINPSNTFLPSIVVSLIANDNYLYAGTFDSGIYRSNDSDYNWEHLKSPCGECLLAGNGNNIFTNGIDSIYISSDNGTSWYPTSDIYASAHFTGQPAAIVAIGNDIFIGIQDEVGGIVLSTDLGQSWSEIGTMHLVNSLFIFGNYIFAGTNNTGLYRAKLSDFGIDAVIPSFLPGKQNFKLLSNPITSSADFQFDALKEPTVFELFDALGRSVLRQQLPAGQATLHVDMQKYPTGIYFARLSGNTVRVVKL